MKPTDLKCYPQVAAVIGEALADYELKMVIASEECEKHDVYNIGFRSIDSPQGQDFWRLIIASKNPYEHGHKKPKIKEWTYTEWLGKKDWFEYEDGFLKYEDEFYPVRSSLAYCHSIVKPTHKPEYIPQSETGDKIGARLAPEEEPNLVLDIDYRKSMDKRIEDGNRIKKMAAEMTAPTNKYKVLCKGVEIDVYDVLMAYGVTNPADQHAIKKMLMPGRRGGKSASQDRLEAIQSLERAIELAQSDK